MREMNFEPRHQDMKRHVTSGVLSSGVTQIVRVLCQFGSVIVLSRLLPPNDFGIIAMVSPVYGFILLFQDLGLGQATVQKSGLTYAEVNAFFWLNALAGAILSVTIVALSPIAAWYYGEPRVEGLTAAMGLLVFVGALGSQPGAILTRRMEFKKSSSINMIGAILGLAVSIVAALFLRSYWALYWGLVAGTIIPAIGAWAFSGWIPSWPRRVKGIGSTLKFGASVTSGNVSSFFSTNIDNVLIGWRWGEIPLGLYDRAYKLLLFPIQRVVAPLMGTIVPVLCRLTERPEKYRELVVQTITHLTLALWPGIIWAAIFSDALVITLLGPRWTEAARIFRPLALVGIIQVVNYPVAGLFVSQGRGGDYAKLSLLNAIIDVFSFFIGLPYGPQGVAIAYAISECGRAPILWTLATNTGPFRRLDIFLSLRVAMISGLATTAALLLLKFALNGSPLFILICSFAIAYFVAGVAMVVTRSGRRTLSQGFDMARSIVH